MIAALPLAVVTEFWGGLLAFIFYIALLTLWVFCFVDIFSRRGISGWAKAAWVFFILFVPFIGALLYIATRRPTEKEMEYAQSAVNEQATYIQSASGELERLGKLRESGQISESEYQSLKNRVVMGQYTGETDAGKQQAA